MWQISSDDPSVGHNYSRDEDIGHQALLMFSWLLNGTANVWPDDEEDEYPHVTTNSPTLHCVSHTWKMNK